jgi:hypothetical protein
MRTRCISVPLDARLTGKASLFPDPRLFLTFSYMYSVCIRASSFSIWSISRRSKNECNYPEPLKSANFDRNSSKSLEGTLRVDDIFIEAISDCTSRLYKRIRLEQQKVDRSILQGAKKYASKVQNGQRFAHLGIAYF